jgi:thymidylate synthase
MLKNSFKMYEGEGLAEIYKAVYEDMSNTDIISPRGLKTKEIICPQILIKNPRSRLAYHKDRKFSLKYALVESLMLIDKSNELKYFEKFNKNMINFSDDGKTLYGSYGYRIADYILPIIDKIKKDESSRQIVIPILRIEDVIKNAKDIPCTINMQIIIRDNKLNMITNMRSNDIIWGLPYDVFMFTILQEIIANTLGYELGWYLHRPVSLHLYEQHFEMFENIAKDFKEVIYKNENNIFDWLKIKEDYKLFIDGKNNGNLFNETYKIIYKIYNKVSD